MILILSVILWVVLVTAFVTFTPDVVAWVLAKLPPEKRWF